MRARAVSHSGEKKTKLKSPNRARQVRPAGDYPPQAGRHSLLHASLGASMVVRPDRRATTGRGGYSMGDLPRITELRVYRSAGTARGAWRPAGPTARPDTKAVRALHVRTPDADSVSNLYSGGCSSAPARRHQDQRLRARAENGQET